MTPFERPSVGYQQSAERPAACCLVDIITQRSTTDASAPRA